MTFEEILDQAMAMLQRRGRLTYNTLKRQFQLDDAALEDLKNEFIYGQRLAVDEEERVLVWRGETLSAPLPTTAPPPARASEPARMPLAYTPAHLAEKILVSRSALEGERKQVTVLFADLKGSMELLADRDPEEARAAPSRTRLQALAARGLTRFVGRQQELEALRQAGAQAFALSADQEAAARFEQALGALEHLPDRRDTREQALELRLDLRQALHPLAELGRILDHLRQAERLAEALGNQRRLGLIAGYMASCLYHLGDAAGGLAYAQRALAMATALGDVGLQVAANTYLGEIYLVGLSDYRRAAEVYSSNIEALHDAPLGERFGAAMVSSVQARAYLAWCLAELGTFAEGRGHGEDALRIAEVVDHPYSLAQACNAVGYLHLRQGALPQTIRVLERGLALSEALQFPEASRPCRARLGRVYALSGRVARALPRLERVFEQAGAMRITIHVIELGEGYVLAGRVEEALPLGQRALEAARAQKQQGYQAYALRLLGEIAGQRDPPDVAQAEHYYRQAMALATALGMRPLLAHGHLGLGTLYAKMRRREEAHAELATAIDRYRAMDMTLWLPQTEAALAQVEGR